MLRPLSSLQGELPRCPVKPLSLLFLYSGGWCPCRAVLSCFGVNQTDCPVHSTLQGRRSLTSSRRRLTRGPIGGQEEEAPGAESILHRCTSEEEKAEGERRLTWYMKMSPERRDLVPVETINSSLQWLPEGPRASRVPSGEEKVGSHAAREM